MIAGFGRALRARFDPPLQRLACIYTCEAHRHLLPRFHDSEAGRLLRETPGTRVLEVYGNPGVRRSGVRGKTLELKVEERYDALSMKTWRMVEFCVRNFRFRQLLKIDVTTAMTELDGPEYAGRSAIDPAALAAFLRGADAGRDYDGLTMHANAGRAGAEGWARKKGGAIDYARVFGDGPIPPFYSGKCYVLGRKFAEFVADRGAAFAEEQARYFMGSEDVMVGRLYERFRAGPAT